MRRKSAVECKKVTVFEEVEKQLQEESEANKPKNKTFKEIVAQDRWVVWTIWNDNEYRIGEWFEQSEMTMSRILQDRWLVWTIWNDNEYRIGEWFKQSEMTMCMVFLKKV